MVFMEKVNFIKMHGLGNDFVILDARARDFGDLASLSIQLADRRFGVGCDQVIVLENTPKADVRMGIYNPDGSLAGMCGNAARCVADLILNEKRVGTVTIEIGHRVVVCTRADGGMVTVDMGEPRLDWNEIPLAQECDTRFVPVDLPDLTDPADSESWPVCVSMGNPHCVFFVGRRVEDFPVAELGPFAERHAMFPERTNVEFVYVRDRGNIRMRVWERGAGITFACGSGACAAAVAAIRRGYADRILKVHMDGGPLTIEWREVDNHITMTGPVAYVFRGELLVSSDTA